jgi:hypothetical protein
MWTGEVGAGMNDALEQMREDRAQEVRGFRKHCSIQTFERTKDLAFKNIPISWERVNTRLS